MNTDEFTDGLQMLQKALNKLSDGPFDYTLKCLIAAKEALLTRYAPFKVGDRVRLTKAPIITEEIAWGWSSSKHFLVPGATGIVRDSAVYSDGKLVFYVEFDNETWVDDYGYNGRIKNSLVPVSSKHWYTFGESYLEKE
jgi:hypothetical protein